MKKFLSKDSDKLTRSDIEQLQELYQEEFGNTFCGNCQGEILTAFKKIKSLYMITDFELKGLNPYYRLVKGKAGTISNSQMTNELALEFLKINPDRIKLFSKFPENWRELVGTVVPDRKAMEAMKYNELAKAYPESFKIGMKKQELIDNILSQ